MLRVVVCLAAALGCSCTTAWAQTAQGDVRQAAAGGTTAAQDESPSLTIGSHRVRFGIDFNFAMVYDQTLMETMGRERQIKPAFINLSVTGSVNDHLSYTVVINPVQDGPVPRPYIPSPTDRRTYFFPNQPEGRGVSSDPEGLYKVDDYKFSAFDPIIDEGILRVGYVDVHTKASGGTRQFGALIGRSYVPQGFGLDDVTWYTAKDLTHIQRINFQADNGVFLYMTDRRLSANLVAVTGNANPYHDYGYFDFTDPTEDKNSALAFVGSARWTDPHYTLGVSYRKNYVNSRIEDAISLQLSKHNDDAIVVSASVTPTAAVRVFGEFARYTWGLAATSAALLPGPAVESPVVKSGFYAGTEVTSPMTPLGRWTVSAIYEKLSRDDALVAFAAANGMFGVRLGEYERTTIVKAETRVMGKLACYGFWSYVSNPFPKLSALQPISGPGSDSAPGGKRIGLGIRFRL
jgi:hypothetical protein